MESLLRLRAAAQAYLPCLRQWLRPSQERSRGLLLPASARLMSASDMFATTLGTWSLQKLVAWDRAVAALQELIDSGAAWRLEGSVGRSAMSSIEAGFNVLGKVGHRDFYGNYIPSRYEVQAGTKGSIEFAREQTGYEYD